MAAKPYHSVTIQECGEPLVPIPLEQFAVVHPHPYAVLGAPYGERSPYYVRQGVLQGLLQAQDYLQMYNSGWQIQIFDAYRPIAVQRFMVEHTYEQLLQVWQRESPGRTREHAPKDDLLAQVYQFWAAPSHNVATPPPHSTGAAVDITLVNAQHQVVDMGSAIDEISERSHPNYFVDKPDGEIFHHHRTLLSQAMQTAGFRQHPNEWWHFSLGDQLWAWLGNSDTAQYGRVD